MLQHIQRCYAKMHYLIRRVNNDFMKNYLEIWRYHVKTKINFSIQTLEHISLAIVIQKKLFYHEDKYGQEKYDLRKYYLL